MPSAEYEQNVFINCPFDPEYAPLFEAIVRSELKLDLAELTFADFSYTIARWLRGHT
jgi:hypothetical protein